MSIKPYQIGDVVMTPHDEFLNEVGESTHTTLKCDGSIVTASEYPSLSEKLVAVKDELDYTKRKVVLAAGLFSEANTVYGVEGIASELSEYRFNNTREKDIGAFDMSDHNGDKSVDLSISSSLATSVHHLYGGSSWHGPYTMDIVFQYLDSNDTELFAVRWLDTTEVGRSITYYRIANGSWISIDDTSGHSTIAKVTITDNNVNLTPTHATAASFFETDIPVLMTDFSKLRVSGDVSKDGYASTYETFCGVSVEVAEGLMTLPVLTDIHPGISYRLLADL